LDNLPNDTSNYYTFDCRIYSMTILLHGQDDPREAWLDPLNRALAWRYQVDYDCDPGNGILDGGGVDDINSVTWGRLADETRLSINPADGIWSIQVDFYVPIPLWQLGRDVFILIVNNEVSDSDLATEIVDICMRQMSSGSVQVVTLDQASCAFSPIRPSLYHLFDDIRPPGALGVDETWRDCAPTYPTVTSLDLKSAAMDNAQYDDDGNLIPVRQEFNLYFQDTALGLIQCSDAQ